MKKMLVAGQHSYVPVTEVDVGNLMKDIDFKPVMPVAVGGKRFMVWYREYYG